MTAEFLAGYISGAAGIIIGNPLDIIKVRLQSGNTSASALVVPAATVGSTTATTTPITRSSATSTAGQYVARSRSLTSWVRGATAPILTYGALNAILYSTYSRCMNAFDDRTIGQTTFPESPFWQLWTAGALGGLATWLVSAPTELVKCQAQLQEGKSSWGVARDVWRDGGVRGLYRGGGITSVRDAVGYGFYFWSYEAGKRVLGYRGDGDGEGDAVKVLIAGGIAGVVTWTSIYPLDVIKTRIQSPVVISGEAVPLLMDDARRRGTWAIVKIAYRQDGVGVFFRGLGVCNVRAFIVNAVQWFVYEKVMTMARTRLQDASGSALLLHGMT